MRLTFFLISIILASMVLLSCFDPPELEETSTVPVSIYPSPARDYARINLLNSSSKDYTVKVFNTKGEILMSASAGPGHSQIPVDLSGEDAGYCHVVVDTGGETVVRKFLVL